MKKPLPHRSVSIRSPARVRHAQTRLESRHIAFTEYNDGFVKGVSTTVTVLPTHTQLLFCVQCSKNLKNLQGGEELTLPSFNRPNGTRDVVMDRHKTRSNASSGFAVNSPNVFVTNQANVTQRNANGIEASPEGFACSTSGPDKVSNIIYCKAGGTWYLNKCVGGQHVKAPVYNGERTVTGKAVKPQTAITKYIIEENGALTPAVLPGLSSTFFVGHFQGHWALLRIVVYDQAGRLPEVPSTYPESQQRSVSALTTGRGFIQLSLARQTVRKGQASSPCPFTFLTTRKRPLIDQQTK